ncbi:MAG: substrate-binding domain-containing protein [Granulosicoccus sp.]
MRMKLLKTAALSGTLAVSTMTGTAQADAMSDAMEFVNKYAMKVETWDGPTTGPKAIPDQTIVVLAGDLKNGGILGATTGIEEAAEAIGWTVRVLDGAGTVSGRTSAMGQALALKPNGIILNGFDSQEQMQGMLAAAEAGIPLVSWHAGSAIGPMDEAGIFANVTTDPMLVSESAAKWAFADADGKPNVIIFTDSTYQIAIDKADRMKEVIEELGGTVLEYVDTPIAETSQRMPQLTTSLLQRYGSKWTHSLAINDLYFDFMGPSLAAAGIKGDGAPVNVSAGDGSESSYQRIRSRQYQQVTVAEPLNLQGWQLIDEMNRALAGEEWSGYVSPLHVVTTDNVEFDGGPRNTFDPENGYQDAYKKIWSGS